MKRTSWMNGFRTLFNTAVNSTPRLKIQQLSCLHYHEDPNRLFILACVHDCAHQSVHAYIHYICSTHVYITERLNCNYPSKIKPMRSTVLLRLGLCYHLINFYSNHWRYVYFICSILLSSSVRYEYDLLFSMRSSNALFALFVYIIYIIITKDIRYLLWNRGRWRSLNNTYPIFLTPCIRCTNQLCDSCDLTDVNPHLIPSLLRMIQNVNQLWRHRQQLWRHNDRFFPRGCYRRFLSTMMLRTGSLCQYLRHLE